LDTLPEADFDNLTAIAAEICGTPISLVSLIDNKRQWFKSHHGLSSSETPKAYAFCAHAIHDPHNVFIVEDARKDERFQGNPLVTGEPHVIFYAGVPLTSENGLPLGTLCVIDHKPKLLTQNQIRSLDALSKQVMNLFKLRKSKLLLDKAVLSLEEKNQELESFAFMAAHDIKSPLINISSLARLFIENYGSKIDREGQTMIEFIESSSDKLRGLVDGLLTFSRSEKLLKEKKSWIDLEVLTNEIADLFSYEKELKLSLISVLHEIYGNRTAIDKILINLVANAIKYNDKKNVEIEIGVSEDNTTYQFYVQDNGPGILTEHQERIFRMFEVLAEKDKFGQTGNGIGLATVKKIVEKMGGLMQVESEVGKGAKFIFTIEK
jgi:signal transduction histidine kinase